MPKITALLFLLFAAGCQSAGYYPQSDFVYRPAYLGRATAPEIAPVQQPVMIARPWCGIGC